MRKLIAIVVALSLLYGPMFGQWGAVLAGSVAASGYAATATQFPTSASVTRTGDPTGATNGKTGVLSFWYKSHASGNSEVIFYDTGFDMILQKTATGVVRLQWFDFFGPTLSLDMSSTASVEGGAWHHIAMMWDTTDVTKCKVYVDGTQGTTNTVTIGTNNLYYAPGKDWVISYPALPIDADLCEFWLAENYWIDLATNITKFRTVGGKPAGNLNTTTGQTATFYNQTLYTAILTNAGSGGNWTTLTGSVSSATAP